MSENKTFIARIQPVPANFRFSRNFWFLVPISRWRQLTILHPLRTPMNTGDAKHRNSAPAITTFTYHQIVIRQWEEMKTI